MESIYLEGTNTTPKINFNYAEGLIEIKGRTFPAVYGLFYDPLIEWVREYIKDPKPQTKVIIELDHLNSGSIFAILEIFGLLDRIYKQGKNIEVKWYYEIDDNDDRFILGVIEDVRVQVIMPINLIELEPSEE